ncbi:MAG TPA: ABC transporter substrate-binding protein [Gammaproteobacteria bacterium]
MRVPKVVGLMTGLLFAGIVLNPAYAEEPAVPEPQALVEAVTEKVLQALKEYKAKEDPAFLDEKIQELIVSQMDFEAMAKLVLGKHWRTATPEQRGRFVEEFKSLLIRTYRTSLTEYSEEKVTFLPFREGEQPEKLATVKSEIIRSNGPTIPINYSLRYKKEDGWKVYDIGIEGVSLVTNYRSSFAREINQNGMDKLIESLRQRNAGKATEDEKAQG